MLEKDQKKRITKG